MKARIARFAASGVINTAVDVATFAALIWATTLTPFTANLIAFAVAVTGSFLLNRFWTFRDRRAGSPLAFALWMTAIALVSSWLVASLAAGGMALVIAKPLTVLAVMAVSFAAMNTLVFQPTRAKAALAGGAAALGAALILVTQAM